jgi:hypothetical protein
MEQLLYSRKFSMYIKLLFVVLIVTLISCNERPSVNLGSGYRFDYDPVTSSDYYIDGPNFNIFNNVERFAFDSVFIIVEQKPRDLILEHVYLDFDEQEKIFAESPLRHYWIINKSIDSLYGPYTLQEFEKKRLEINVPSNLKFPSLSVE